MQVTNQGKRRSSSRKDEQASECEGSVCRSKEGVASAASAAGALPNDELVIEARRQISIRCGKASITLYANGKIALRGEYIVSDAEGVNRIAGGQIELN